MKNNRAAGSRSGCDADSPAYSGTKTSGLPYVSIRRCVVPTGTVLSQTIATRGSASDTTSSTMLVSALPSSRGGVGTQMTTKSVSMRSSRLPRPCGGSYGTISCRAPKTDSK
jgi:hypothetical protein